MKSDLKKGLLEGTKDGETNILGGKNPNSLYVPMSEDEQEVIQRLVEADDLVLIIHGWATLDKPHILVGDHRVGVQFRLDFPKGMQPVRVGYFDLELRRRNEQTVFREKKAIQGADGKPLLIQGGTFFELQWDIAIHSMDPEFVKAVKPGAVGLTSRRIDKDTGERTSQGNMDLDSVQKNALAFVEQGSAKVKAEDAASAAKAVAASED